MHYQTPRPVWNREDFTESRLIISRLVSANGAFLTGKIYMILERMHARLFDLMDPSENAPSLIPAQRATRELTFISLLSVATSLPAEVTEQIIFSRLYLMRVTGIRGASWIATMLSSMPAHTLPSPEIVTVSLGAGLSPTRASLARQNATGSPRSGPSAHVVDPEIPSE